MCAYEHNLRAIWHELAMLNVKIRNDISALCLSAQLGSVWSAVVSVPGWARGIIKIDSAIDSNVHANAFCHGKRINSKLYTRHESPEWIWIWTWIWIWEWQCEWLKWTHSYGSVQFSFAAACTCFSSLFGDADGKFAFFAQRLINWMMSVPLLSHSLSLWLSSSFLIYLYGANRNHYMIATTFTTHFVAIYAVHTIVHFYHLGGISSTHTACISTATLSDNMN